ncbi:SHOCT domain-containing protein [Nitrospira defluvii]|nr:SHOCT domain-containing protein [Nitrospira defluvii]
MRHNLLLIWFFSLAACTGNAHFQRVVHEGTDHLVVLDKGEVSAMPSFLGPFQHPTTISPDVLQEILESVHVVPNKGILNALISGKDNILPLFDSDAVQLMSVQLSEALAKADVSEHARFYFAVPRNTSEVSLTSGFLLVKDKRLHLRINHYKVPHRKRNPFSTVGNGIPPSETMKYRFTLSENKQMAHRTFKNVFGFEGSDPHWLVIEYIGFTPSSERIPLLETTERLEEKLRVLKRLKEERLISEEEYSEKKRSLLREF